MTFWTKPGSNKKNKSETKPPLKQIKWHPHLLRKERSLFYLQFQFRFQFFHWCLFRRVLPTFTVSTRSHFYWGQRVGTLRVGTKVYLIILHAWDLAYSSDRCLILCEYMVYVPSPCKSSVSAAFLKCSVFIHSLSYSFTQPTYWALTILYLLEKVMQASCKSCTSTMSAFLVLSSNPNVKVGKFLEYMDYKSCERK